jgi:F0F1-type ATP synthase membrane subunit c/vacuolar-type H+-ATPase subunit K
MKHLVLILFFLPIASFAQTHCFTQKQLSEDMVLKTKLQGLQELSPSVFTNDGVNLCFDRKTVASGDEKDFDYFIDWHHQHRTSEEGEIVLRNQDQTFRVKFLRGFLIAEVPQLAGLGILLLLPSSISQWPEDPLKDGLKNLKRAYTQPPVWDKDRWWVNAGHPLAGAVYYNLVRSQDATPFQSFLFSTFQSVAWEYGMEAVAEQPSIQDLLSTSTIGALIGEAQHQATLRMAKNGFSRFEKVLVVILNPSYVVNNGFKVKRRSTVPAPF